MKFRLRAGALLVALAAAVSAAPAGAQVPDTGDTPISAEWLSNTLSRAAAPGSVQNNTIDGALERRDAAAAQWRDAVARYQAALAAAKKAKGAKRARLLAKARAAYPDPHAKPEYSVVWSAKQNAADVNADVISKFVQNATINPQGLLELSGPQFTPGLDGFQVIDVRRVNVDGSENLDYGKVVNFVQLPLPWGVETEAHHMQYEWNDGDPIVAAACSTTRPSCSTRRTSRT